MIIPFGFYSVSVGQGLDKYDFDLAAPRRIERASDNGEVSLDQGQIHLYYCSANVILLHCFCSLFPCQIWLSISPWFVSSREHSFWIEFCPGLCSCSKNRCAKILAGQSLSCVEIFASFRPALRFQWDGAFLWYEDELFLEKRMVLLRFCFNNCIFLQRTIISFLSCYKPG